MPKISNKVFCRTINISQVPTSKASIMIPYHIFDCQLVINISMSTCNLPHAIDYSAYCQIRSQLVVAFLTHDIHYSFLPLRLYVTSIKHKKLTHHGLIMSGLYFTAVLFYENPVYIMLPSREKYTKKQEDDINNTI